MAIVRRPTRVNIAIVAAAGIGSIADLSVSSNIAVLMHLNLL